MGASFEWLSQGLIGMEASFEWLSPRACTFTSSTLTHATRVLLQTELHEDAGQWHMSTSKCEVTLFWQMECHEWMCMSSQLGGVVFTTSLLGATQPMLLEEVELLTSLLNGCF